MTLNFWGGLIRWLIKRCKTNFVDVYNNSDEFENLLLSIGLVIVLLILVYLFF